MLGSMGREESMLSQSWSVSKKGSISGDSHSAKKSKRRGSGDTAVSGVDEHGNSVVVHGHHDIDPKTGKRRKYLPSVMPNPYGDNA